jgi:hypothetical protein
MKKTGSAPCLRTGLGETRRLVAKDRLQLRADRTLTAIRRDCQVEQFVQLVKDDILLSVE